MLFYHVNKCCWYLSIFEPGLEVIQLEYSLKLKIKRNDWSASNQSLRLILSLRMNLEARFMLILVEHDTCFITSEPDYFVYVVIISSIVTLLLWR